MHKPSVATFASLCPTTFTIFLESKKALRHTEKK